MANTLPRAPWSRRADLSALIAALGTGNARYVGGAVRDTLLGLAVKDIDLATPLVPDEVIARLKQAKIRTVPTGIAHGTVTALLDQGPVRTILHITQSAAANSLRYAVHGSRGSYIKHGLDPQEDRKSVV